MSHQPVNPDDLDLTAYALGEMTNSERIEFENRLQDSPDAQLELEAMDEITSLLSSSLRDEWRKEMKEPSLEVLPGAEERVVTGQFRTPNFLKFHILDFYTKTVEVTLTLLPMV